MRRNSRISRRNCKSSWSRWSSRQDANVSWGLSPFLAHYNDEHEPRTDLTSQDPRNGFMSEDFPEQIHRYGLADRDGTTSTPGLPNSSGLVRPRTPLPTSGNSPDSSPFREDGRPVPESGRSFPESSCTLAHCESWINTSTIPRFVPSRFTCQCSTAAFLGRHVIKEDQRFATEMPNIKSILHDEENINVLRIGLIRDKRAKDDESAHLPGVEDQGVDTAQSLSYNAPLETAPTKMIDYVVQVGSVNAGRKISTLVELTPCCHTQNCTSDTWRLQFPVLLRLRPRRGIVLGAGLTYLYLGQVFSYSLKFFRQTRIPFRTLAQTIDRLTSLLGSRPNRMPRSVRDRESSCQIGTAIITRASEPFFVLPENIPATVPM